MSASPSIHTKRSAQSFPFAGENQGSDRLARHQAAKIVAQLTVEIPETIRAGYANASARSREEKSSLPAKMS